MKKIYKLKIMMTALLVLLMTVGNVFADKGWVKVTYTSNLSAGDTVIIAAGGTYNKAMGAQNTNNRAAVNIVKSADGGRITSINSAQMFIVQEGNVLGTIAFFDPNLGGYLYAAGEGTPSSGNNFLRTKDTLDIDGRSNWQISFSNDGDIEGIVAQTTETNRVNMRFNNSSNIFSCYASGQSAVAIYRYEEVVAATVAAPVISPAGGTYYSTQSVSITCATPNATILYTIDGSNPATNGITYSAPLTVPTTTTVKAVAFLGTDTSSASQATYTIMESVEVSNIAAFKTAASAAPSSNTVYKIAGDVTYVFRSGRYMFVEDASAALLIFDNSTPVITSTYTEGDVISGGVFGTYSLYNGMSEMVPKQNTAAATGTPATVTPMMVTIPTLVAQYNTYESRLVTINNVTFIGNKKFVNGTDTLNYYNRFGSVNNDPDAGTVGSVTGFVANYNGQVQLYPRNNADLTTAPLPTPPTLTVTLNGEQFSTLDTLQVSFDIQNFTLGTDGLLKLESQMFAAAGMQSPMYLNDQMLAFFLAQTFSPLPAGIHNVTASLVDMTQQPLTPAVSQTVTFTVTAPVAATPVISPNAGMYTDSVVVSMFCATPGAQIRYTIAGEEPSTSSTLYEGQFTLNSSRTVKAKAFMNNVSWEDSPVAVAAYTIVSGPTLTVDPTSLAFGPNNLTSTVNIYSASLTDPITISCNNNDFQLSDTSFSANVGNTSFTITYTGFGPASGMVTVSSGNLSATIDMVATAQLPAPVITPASGTTGSQIIVEMTDAVQGAGISYTIDGTDPDINSPVYNQPIILNVPGTYTVKAFAFLEGWGNSEIVTATYTVELSVVETPVITPAGGSTMHYEPVVATITCATTDAVIRYTTDGTEPTETSTVYSAPVTISTTTTLKVKAWKSGYEASAVATATYNFPVKVANIAAFKQTASTAASNTIFKITGDVTFVYRNINTNGTNGRYMFVQDETAALLIFDNSNAVITTTYTEGAVISGGVFGKFSAYNSMAEMIPTHNTAEATGTPVAITPMVATIPNVVSQYSTYESRLVTIENVTFIGNSKFVNGTDTLEYYNRFNTVTENPEVGETGSITGFVAHYTGNRIQLYPRDNNDFNTTPVVIDQVATPVFAPAAGEYENSVEVSISCTTEDATIYYTLDGTEPDVNATEYTEPFTLTATTTVKAIAVKEGMTNSEVATATYDITTGIRDMQQNVSIYPNPTNGNVTIDLSGLNAKTVELFSVGGQLLYSVVPTENVMTLSLNEYAAGVYFVRIHSANAVTTQKIVKK